MTDELLAQWHEMANGDPEQYARFIQEHIGELFGSQAEAEALGYA
jgi:hypothetical protein